MTTKLLLALVLCIVFSLAASVPKVSQEVFKSVQGPPEEFAQHQLPDPGAAAQTSDSYIFPVAFQPQPDGKKEMYFLTIIFFRHLEI